MYFGGGGFRDPIVLRGLNVDINESSSPRIQRVAYLLAEYGLIDLFLHFCQHCRFQNQKTWSQVRQGTVLQSRCEHIIGTNRRLFEMVGIQDMRNFLSDHFALRARILQCPTLCHARYLSGRRAFLIRPPPQRGT